MKETDDPDVFEEKLLEFLQINEAEEIREVCEAIRQMYDIDLIDVINDVIHDEERSEPFTAAGKNHNH